DLADGRLTAQQLLQGPDLGFALAWVNGCESGRSAVRPGDELLGFVRGLLAGVAPSLLLTLWSVEDLTARLFARLFYTELLSSENGHQASLSHTLRRSIARLRWLPQAEAWQILREDGHNDGAISQMLGRLPRQEMGEMAAFPFTHPYFWAAYALTGEARAVS
ncbi:MAG: CHAT domain-containing protein, partial [Chloroflexi bacterium]|nr:CHAT domain-containing protein [Chloroflexota bacterium]